MSSDLQGLEEAYIQAEDKTAALDALLSRFPLLHLYWLKRIELAEDPAVEWGRALEQCNSLDLWIAFVTSPEGQSLEAAKKAVDNCGQYFQSHPLWEALLDRCNNDEALLLQVLNIPLYAYATFFQRAYDAKIHTETELEGKSETMARKVHEMWDFESQLKRPYFDPRDVEIEELRTWSAYIQYMLEKKAPCEFIQQLFERCLITTALYPDFWLLYLRWALRAKLVVDNIFKRALFYHPTHTTLNSVYARWLEEHGDIVGAERYKGALKDQTTEAIAQIRTPEEIVQVFSVADPIELFPLWKKGMCPDPVAYARRLETSGRLDLFFAVDSTLKYIHNTTDIN